MGDKLLKEWKSRVRLSQHSHHENAKSMHRVNKCLGLVIVITTVALSGSWWLEFFGAGVPSLWKVILATASLFLAVLAAIQTFSRFEEKAEKHEQLGARYGILRREIEQILYSSSEVNEEMLASIRKKIDILALETPVVTTKIHLKVLNSIKDEDEPNSQKK